MTDIQLVALIRFSIGYIPHGVKEWQSLWLRIGMIPYNLLDSLSMDNVLGDNSPSGEWDGFLNYREEMGYKYAWHVSNIFNNQWQNTIGRLIWCLCENMCLKNCIWDNAISTGRELNMLIVHRFTFN